MASDDVKRGRVDRRKLVSGVAGLAAGVLASGKVDEAEAQVSSGDPLLVGRDNLAQQLTGLLLLDRRGGTALELRSVSGTGLVSQGPNAGVAGLHLTGGSTGTTNPPVRGAGVFGGSAFRTGVHGAAGDLRLIKATSTAVAVRGTFVESDLTGEGTAVIAENTGRGLALDVVGRVRFSTSGRSSVEARRDNVLVLEPSVQESSHVNVTLLADPGSGNGVAWVELVVGVGFVVHLHRSASKLVPFTYLVIDGTR